MKINCGIIGLPNVGKSTLFKSLSNIAVKIANFPFCTIQPNIAVVQIPDNRLCQLNNIIHAQKIVHSTIEFIDIAGLIKGASNGEGLGNKILYNIQTAKILCHVVRCFDDEKISHIEKYVDPYRDINIINTELILFDILICEKNIFSLQKSYKHNDQHVDQKLIILKKCLNYLYEGISLRKINFSSIDQEIIRKFNFLTVKPIIYIANVDIKHIYNVYLNELHKLGLRENTPVILYNYKDLEKKSTYITQKHHNILNIIVNNILYLLKLNNFFTVNNNMIRSWINSVGTTALDASSYVHSDFKKGFIRAQVIKFNDFIKYNGEVGSKIYGKIRYEGKKYRVEDGDILKFLFHI